MQMAMPGMDQGRADNGRARCGGPMDMTRRDEAGSIKVGMPK